jgi:hypothetical protein
MTVGVGQMFTAQTELTVSAAFLHIAGVDEHRGAETQRRG